MPENHQVEIRSVRQLKNFQIHEVDNAESIRPFEDHLENIVIILLLLLISIMMVTTGK